MRIIGVTGGVGSGKSSVLNYIECHHDARVVKADDVGHLLMMPGGKCYQPVIDLFGPGIVKKDESLNRELMAKIVFQSRHMLDKLNAVIHPAVKDYIKNEVEKARNEGVEFFFIEAALLIEDNYDEIYEELWYVYCEEAVRRERLRSDRGYSDEKIDELMENQLSEDEYEARSDFQLYNSEDAAHTHLQIERRIRKYYETM